MELFRVLEESRDTVEELAIVGDPNIAARLVS
jgi:hypothetical protein